MSGVLVDGHDPRDWADVLAGLAAEPRRLAALGRGAVDHAGAFGWSVTAARTLDVYAAALGATAATLGGPAADPLAVGD